MSHTILVAEDDSTISSLIQEVVKRMGETPVPAVDGDEAIQIFSTRKIDLIITDIKMPKTDGITFIKKVREQNREIPIVIITGYGSEKNRVLARNYGVKDFLNKPCSIVELVQTIKKNLLPK